MKRTISKTLEWAICLFSPNKEERSVRQAPAPSKPLDRPSGVSQVHYCHHARHGASPVRFQFKMRTVSDNGRPLTILECGDSHCREFIALTSTKDVLFRGHHFKDRNRDNSDSFRFPRSAK